MIEARYHGSVAVLQALTARGAWPGPRTPFARPEWFALLADAGIVPLVAVAEEPGTGAAAALALTENRGRIASLRNWYSFTWAEMAPPGGDGDRLLAAIARGLKSRAYRVTLEPVPDEEGSAGRLARAFRSAGWRVAVESCDISHILRLDGRSFAQYWADRPGPLRSTLKRKGGKVETSVLTRFDAAAFAEYEAVYAASWKPAEDHPAMLRAFARGEGEAGRLRLGIARADGIAVAAQLWTVENSTAYIHKLAHLESHRALSAGTTLSAALLAHVIDTDKVEAVDFGTGDQPYKSDWMEETRPRYRIDCLDPAAPRAWPALARRWLRRAPATAAATLAPGAAHG